MLAIVPARGGSKGVPGKNIKELCGKPLIAYTIDEAKKSQIIDRLVLSTDDEQIAKVSEKYDIEIPFMRPPKLSQDSSLAIDNYIYTLDRLNKEFKTQHDEFIVLQPTSPFRLASDIDAAISLFYEKNADSVISVCEAPHPPTWSKRMDPSGRLKSYFEMKSDNKNRQEIESAYIPNGAIFILKLSSIKSIYSYYTDKTYGYEMPSARSIDIDTPLDFEFAEFLMRKQDDTDPREQMKDRNDLE